MMTSDERAELLDDKIARLLVDIRGDVTSVYERCTECFLDDKSISSKFKYDKKYWINAIRSAGQVAKNRDHYGKIISRVDIIKSKITPINKAVNKILYLLAIPVLVLGSIIAMVAEVLSIFSQLFTILSVIIVTILGFLTWYKHHLNKDAKLVSEINTILIYNVDKNTYKEKHSSLIAKAMWNRNIGKHSTIVKYLLLGIIRTLLRPIYMFLLRVIFFAIPLATTKYIECGCDKTKYKTYFKENYLKKWDNLRELGERFRKS